MQCMIDRCHSYNYILDNIAYYIIYMLLLYYCIYVTIILLYIWYMFYIIYGIKILLF